MHDEMYTLCSSSKPHFFTSVDAPNNFITPSYRISAATNTVKEPHFTEFNFNTRVQHVTQNYHIGHTTTKISFRRFLIIYIYTFFFVFGICFSIWITLTISVFLNGIIHYSCTISTEWKKTDPKQNRWTHNIHLEKSPWAYVGTANRPLHFSIQLLHGL